MRAHGDVTDATGRRPGDHVCWAYDGVGDFVAAGVPWLHEGAARGERLMYVGAAPMERLLADLAGLPDRDQLVAAGALQLVPLTTLYDVSAPIVSADQLARYDRAVRQALADGYTGLRVLAEVTDLVIDPDRRADHLRWEHFADAYMSVRPLAALCCYRRNHVDGATIRALASVHPLSRVPDEMAAFRLFFDDGRLVLGGTVDTFDSAELASVLAASHVGADSDDVHAHAGPREVVVDVANVDFIDARGATTLAEWGRSLRQRNYQLRLTGAGSLLARVWQALALNEVAGEVLVSRP